MKFILKLLLAPLMLVLWIVEWALTLALKASGRGLCHRLRPVSAFRCFLLCGRQRAERLHLSGHCVSALPYGLHYLAVKLTARFIGMRILLRERIYG